jgi:hypothetical protein
MHHEMEWFLATTPEGDRDTTFGWLKACEAGPASSVAKKSASKWRGRSSYG